MNSINLSIKGRSVNLIVHDDGHVGPAYEVVALRTNCDIVPFARFQSIADADVYCKKYEAYYPFVRFFIRKTLM